SVRLYPNVPSSGSRLRCTSCWRRARSNAIPAAGSLIPRACATSQTGASVRAAKQSRRSDFFISLSGYHKGQELSQVVNTQLLKRTATQLLIAKRGGGQGSRDTALSLNQCARVSVRQD